MRELEYPFSSQTILKKKKSLRRKIKEKNKFDNNSLDIKIAVLGGSTTRDILDVLELFLLNDGFNISFYESDYGRYWEELIFDNKQLDDFSPDIIYIHTSMRNIPVFPEISDSKDEIDIKLDKSYNHFSQLWYTVKTKYNCIIIQNNFEYPYYRVMGNMDVYDPHGKIWFINQLNQRMNEYANGERNFYINDINYLSASYGLTKWSDPYYWYMYKYALAVPAIPEFAYNIFNIIKAVYGKNKKAIMVDLDNTIWGGVIAEDGASQIQIGGEGAKGQIFADIQSYLKAQRELGTILTVNSKNDFNNAIRGFKRPESILHQEDFTVIKANWNEKSTNALEIASDLNIGIDSLAFFDDNPAEREEVRRMDLGIGIPELSDPEHYIQEIDKAGYFECIGISDEDSKRARMYEESAQRIKAEFLYDNYDDFLDSLNMEAEIKPFSKGLYSRITQLINKSNQFNLTTKRCTENEIEKISNNPNNITLYGKLKDRFGDNGLVSVIFGHLDLKQHRVFHIDEWVMSCRVLKRSLEYAMMDELIKLCIRKEVEIIIGYYYPTKKNNMVENFYGNMGFSLMGKDKDGFTKWKLNIKDEFVWKNKFVKVEECSNEQE